MVEKDEPLRVIEEDAAALRRVSTRVMPPVASIRRSGAGRERAAWRPRGVVTAGVVAALAFLVLGAVASERFRRLLIPTRGRSASAIESDIKGGLAGEGFDRSTVSVARAPGSLSIDVTAGDSSGVTLETSHRLAGEGADSTFLLELADFKDLEHLPLESRRRAIERRLAERGVRATVTIANGQLRIDADDRRIEREP